MHACMQTQPADEALHARKRRALRAGETRHSIHTMFFFSLSLSTVNAVHCEHKRLDTPLTHTSFGFGFSSLEHGMYLVL